MQCAPPSILNFNCRQCFSSFTSGNFHGPTTENIACCSIATAEHHQASDLVSGSEPREDENGLSKSCQHSSGAEQGSSHSLSLLVVLVPSSLRQILSFLPPTADHSVLVEPLPAWACQVECFMEKSGGNKRRASSFYCFSGSNPELRKALFQSGRRAMWGNEAERPSRRGRVH